VADPLPLLTMVMVGTLLAPLKFVFPVVTDAL
jgi:hypothetical protein